MHFMLAASIIAFAVFALAAPQLAERRNVTAIPIAKHSGLMIQNPNKSVNVDALNKHIASVMAKIYRGFDNFERNTGWPHPSASKGLGKRQSEVAEPETYTDQIYYGMIGVGTPDQAFIVQFDTVSADVVIPLNTCDSSCSGHNLWQPLLSTSGIDYGQTFDIDYGNGRTASVIDYTDIVFVGTATATAQTIGGATHYGSGFQISQFPADGLVGLAFPSVSLMNASPFFQTLVSQGQLPEPVFSFKFAHSGGELMLGGTNSQLYTGSFSYAPVTIQNYWEITIDNVRGYGDPILSNIDCVIDTSAYFISGPLSDVATLYAALGGQPAPSSYGQGYYTLPCDSFQILYFTIGGSPFPIPPSSYNFGTIPTNSSDCLSGIVGQNDNFWILGDVFLRNVYVTFDVGNAQVGFAQLA